ncbi:MAG: EamA family transporter [Firmicutes bacterium]|nr:EamA family transporter [Bacillota bacterium]
MNQTIQKADTGSKKEKQKAMLLMAICASMWSLGGIFIKLISWSPLLIAGVRSLISAGVLGIFMIQQKIPVKFCGYSIGAGIGLSFSCIFFVIANKLTTAANAVVLQYTAPIFILIMTALVLKQKLRRKEILAVAGTMIGIILFFFEELSPGNIAGNILAVLAGAFLAFMFFMVGRGGSDNSIRMSGILFAHLLAAIMGIPVGLAGTTSTTGMEILYILILGIFQLGIPYVLYTVASKDCPPLACSLIGMLEPLLNPVWVLIFTGEMPGVLSLIGAVIIISVVTWWCVSGERHNDKSAAGQFPLDTNSSSLLK